MAGNGVDVSGDKQKVDVAIDGHSCRRSGCDTPHDDESGGQEFDLGYRECEDYKVAPLYAAIEDAITDLMKSDKWAEVGAVVASLRKALKECDDK